MPPGYGCLEKARPRAGEHANSTATNHGGVCLLYLTKYSARVVSLPSCKTLEALAVYLHGSGLNLLVVVLYRPGSAKIKKDFFDEFDNVLERVATFASSIVILGDINIQLDMTESANTNTFLRLLANHDLVQHVSGPTHTGGHTLDVLITRTSVAVPSVIVEEPTLSDHSFILAKLELTHGENRPPATFADRRRWRDFNQERFTDDLKRTPLLVDPPDDVDALFACYDTTLESLLDIHAPLVKVDIRSRPTAPWYDAGCANVKSNTRPLKRYYRAHNTPATCLEWRNQAKYMRYYMQER